MVARLEAVLRRGVWSIRRGISYLLEGWSSSCAVLRRGVWSIKDGVSATCRHRVTVQGRNCVSLICCGRRPFISSSHLLIMGGPSEFVDSCALCFVQSSGGVCGLKDGVSATCRAVNGAVTDSVPSWSSTRRIDIPQTGHVGVHVVVRRTTTFAICLCWDC